LFPHLTVRENIAVVPRLLRWTRPRTWNRVEELLDLLGFDPAVVGNRYPHELSGGQRHRVGIARALAADPLVLLMDEPFRTSSPMEREHLRTDVLRLQHELGITIIYATPDLDEAVRLADRIAVFRPGGLLEQYDTPARVLGTPATPFVVDFTGSDRSLRWLAATPLAADDTEHPPVVRTDTSVAETLQAIARHAAAAPGRPAGAGGSGAGSRVRVSADGVGWAVVVDPVFGEIRGWVEAGELSGRGPVARAASLHPLAGWVELGASLKDVFAALLDDDDARIAVYDRDDYVGVLTPASLHAALRRSIEAHLDAQDDQLVDVDMAETADRNIARPSGPGPVSAATACSGCGINPTTVPSVLQMPAMSATDPFGFVLR
jgi:osmoprotectant transport system ATP-binding protein